LEYSLGYEGTTVIVVTHDARVAACADREIVVSDSKVSTLTGAQG
jgi:putative ABC transport system ATP-binding protein